MRSGRESPNAGDSLKDNEIDVTTPPLAHAREPTVNDDHHAYDSDSDAPEATELRERSSAAAAAAAEARMERLSRVLTPNRAPRNRYGIFKRFWRHHVRIVVPHVDCRDHLANERTFLGYMRTSVALSMMGTLIAQFYALEPDPSPSPVFGYSLLGKPLSVIFQASALIIVLLGCARYLRQQNAMASGKVWAGGWEIMTIIGLVMLLMVGMFFVHLALFIYDDKHPPPG